MKSITPFMRFSPFLHVENSIPTNSKNTILYLSKNGSFRVFRKDPFYLPFNGPLSDEK